MTESTTFTTPEGIEWLMNVLRTTDVVEVVFEKTDGTERTMHCTLKEDKVVPYEKKTDKTRASNPNIVRVWDTDVSEWRSFRRDSIRRISFDL